MARINRNYRGDIARTSLAFARCHIALVALVAADVATKLAAFALLPAGEPVGITRGVGFHLTLNEWGVLGGVEGISAVTANSVYTVMLAVALLGLAVLVRRLARMGLSFPVRVLAGSVAFVVVANVVQFVSRPFANVALPPEPVIYAIRTAALVVSLALYSVSHAPVPSAVFTLLGAGSVANAASYAYPPFEVIDFVRIPLPGQPDAFGVLNLADVYIALSIALALVWPLIALARWGSHLARGATVSLSTGMRRPRGRQRSAPAEVTR